MWLHANRMCCLLPEAPLVASALQALQIASEQLCNQGSLDRLRGDCGDGMTECSDAEVADSLVSIEACGYGRRAVTAVSTPTWLLLAAKDPAWSTCAPGALRYLTFSNFSFYLLRWRFLHGNSCPRTQLAGWDPLFHQA